MKRFKRSYRSIKNNDNKTINITVLIVILMVILGVIIIKFGYNFSKNSVYNYTVKKSDDYIVELKPNTFYANDTLPAGSLCFQVC